MALQWWVYVIIALAAFILLLLIHFILKKVNEALIDERFGRLYSKTSTSTQVQGPLLEMEMRGLKDDKNTTHKNGISLIFSKEENRKSFPSKNNRKGESKTKMNNRGINFQSLEYLSKMEPLAVKKPQSLNIPSHNKLSQTTNSSKFFSTSENANSNVLVPRKEIQYLSEMSPQKTTLIEKEVKITDDINEAADNTYSKFLGAIYCSANVNSRDALTNPYVKSKLTRSVASTNILSHKISTEKKVDKHLTLKLSGVDTNIDSSCEESPKINEDMNLASFIKKSISKVTFENEVAAVRPFDPNVDNISSKVHLNSVKFIKSDSNEQNIKSDTNDYVNKPIQKFYSLSEMLSNQEILNDVTAIETSSYLTNIIKGIDFCEDNLPLKLKPQVPEKGCKTIDDKNIESTDNIENNEEKNNDNKGDVTFLKDNLINETEDLSTKDIKELHLGLNSSSELTNVKSIRQKEECDQLTKEHSKEDG